MRCVVAQQTMAIRSRAEVSITSAPPHYAGILTGIARLEGDTPPAAAITEDPAGIARVIVIVPGLTRVAGSRVRLVEALDRKKVFIRTTAAAGHQADTEHHESNRNSLRH